MEHLNDQLFLLINASAQASALSVLVARIAAQWLIYLPPVIVAALWIWGEPRKRGALVAAALGALLGLAVNQAIGAIWFHPRPFMIGIGRNLMAHAPETSFPSDHATLLWSLGFSLIASRAFRAWGWMVAGLGLAVAWSRVYLGLHFPFDMAGSFAVALGVGALARAVRPTLERRILPPTEHIYVAALRLLRLPPRVFPRQVSMLSGTG